jgi:AcrR family transcriptional regulator
MPVNVKPLIADAFLKLSKEKNIDKITVKDIVDECGISRQSFYYHFQDILEVIEWSAEQAFQKLLERSMETDDAEAVFQDFITASDEASAMLRKLLNSQKREQVERLMVRSVRAYLQELIRRKGPIADIPYEDAEAALSFCTYGIVGLLLEYCEKKDVDRERLARQMYRLLTGRMAERRGA